MGVELLRVPLGADVSGHVSALLRDAARAAPAFSPAPVIYMAANERRARAVSRAAGEQYPEGTPDRVARELLKLTAPQIRLRGEVERDFDFFGALAATLDELGEKRRPGRALVDELLTAWKRLAQTIPPDQRGDLGWLRELGPRGGLFGGVVRRYMERLQKAGQHDPEDAPWLAAAHCDVMPKLFIADDLDRITPAREALLRALAEKSERTLFILRGKSEQLPFLTDAHEVSQALTLGMNGKVLRERKEEDWTRRPFADACDAWLEDATVKADIQLLRPATRAAEVREAARLIKRAHADGTTLGDICVAMPSTSAYRELIEETFAASGIPYDAPFELPLDECAPVAALLDLLRAARNGLERSELLDALASPFLPFRAQDASAQAKVLETLEFRTRVPNANVVGGLEIERDWLKRLDTEGHDDWKVIRDDTIQLLEQLRFFGSKGFQPAYFLEKFEQLIESSGVARVVAFDSKHVNAGSMLRFEALHQFRLLVRQLREEFHQQRIPSLTASNMYLALLEQSHARTVRPPEGDVGRVKVRGLRELRGMAIKRLIVLGLTDQDLPLNEEETLFLPGSREEALTGALGKRAARELCAPIDVAAQSDYLFAHMLMAVDGALALMLPGGENDTPFVPATPFARLLRGMGVEKLDTIPATAFGELPTSPGELAGRAAGMLAKLERDGAAATANLPLSPALQTGLHGRCIELARTDMASAPGEYEGAVGEHNQLAAKFASGENSYLFSPSQLDSYAECPMRFWGRYILRAKAPEEPTLDTKPHAVGTLLHEVFERWVLLLRQEAGQPEILADATNREPLKLSDVGRDAGLRLMAEAFEYSCEKNPGEGPFWEGVKALVASGLPGHADEGLGDGLLVRFVDHELERNEQGWGIRFVEFDFGKDNAPEPDRPDTVPDAIELETPAGRLRLMGSVDRVDEGPDGLEIIDYKTGRTKSTGDVRDGKAFQLPTYLAAISQLVGTPPKGMKYFRVPAEGAIEEVDVTLANKKPAYDVEELVTEKLPDRLGRIVNALRHGSFIHTPFARLDDACKYCDYAAACAKRDDVIYERQARMDELAHVYLPEAK